MWILKQSESTINLLNRNESFKMKVKRRAPRLKDDNFNQKSQETIHVTEPQDEIDNNSRKVTFKDMQHQNSDQNMPTLRLLKANSFDEDWNKSESHESSMINLTSSQTNLKISLELSGQLLLPPQPFIQISNSSFQVFPDIIQQITTPIITVTFFQNANSNSNISQLVSGLCQNKVFEYNFEGIQMSLFEYTIHQKKVTIAFFILEKLTMKKQSSSREENLFYMSMVMSSMFVYLASKSSRNSIIHKDDINTFTYLISLKRKMKKTGHFIRPKLLWLLENDGSSDKSGISTLNSEFEKELHTVDSSRDAKLKFALKKYFPNRTCFVIPRLARNDEVPDYDSIEFKSGVSELRNYIANPKNIMKVPTSNETITITGKLFEPYVIQLVATLNRNQVFIPSEVSKEIVFKDSKALMDQLLLIHNQEIENLLIKLPMEESQLESWNENHLVNLEKIIYQNLIDISELSIRQLKQQIDNIVITDYYKILRENSTVSKQKAAEVLSSLYEKIKIKFPNYRTLDQFNKDISNLKTTFWHESVGSEKQNVWISFYSQNIQPDSIKLRSQLDFSQQYEPQGYGRNKKVYNPRNNDHYSQLHKQLSISSMRITRSVSPTKLSNPNPEINNGKNKNKEINGKSGGEFLARLMFPKKNNRIEKIHANEKTTKFPLLKGNFR